MKEMREIKEMKETIEMKEMREIRECEERRWRHVRSFGHRCQTTYKPPRVDPVAFAASVACCSLGGLLQPRWPFEGVK